MSFALVLPAVLRYEGGYVNDPADSGGATNKGITQKVYDEYRFKAKHPRISVLYITDEEVEEIYYSNYWVASACPHIPFPLAICHFDYAVNSGVNRAKKTLQKILGVVEDGIIGPKTLDAVEKKEVSTLIYEYCQSRREFLNGLAQRRPKDAKFLRGWLKRVADTERRAIAAIPKSAPSSSTS